MIYWDRHQPDSAITHYLKAMDLDTTRSVFFLNNQVLDALIKVKDTRKALEYLEKTRARMSRLNVPYYHLVKGDYWIEMHEPDSAMKHYRIATETGNATLHRHRPYVYNLAFNAQRLKRIRNLRQRTECISRLARATVYKKNFHRINQ